MRACLVGLLVVLVAGAYRAPHLLGDEVDVHLAAIARVGPEAAGSDDARRACDALSQLDAGAIPRLLVAMDTSNPVAANWYRTAFDAVVDRQLAKKRSLPLESIQAIVSDERHAGSVRRLALSLCDRVEPGFAATFIPQRLDDAEFRGDAVDAALAAGEQALAKGEASQARETFLKAFEHARASTQCVRAAERLAALGQRVDTQAHLGLVVDWWLIGPFDAPGFSGFDRPFPPEEAVKLDARYAGQEGQELRWKRYKTSDPLGTVNLVEALSPAREAVGYAFAELESKDAQAAELRCGADDNCTVWLNGSKVFGRQQWLNGTRFDRFVTPVQLRAGKNTLLVKVCQGPPNRDPQVPNNWTVQLRFTDTRGDGLPLRSLLAPIAEVAP